MARLLLIQLPPEGHTALEAMVHADAEGHEIALEHPADDHPEADPAGWIAARRPDGVVLGATDEGLIRTLATDARTAAVPVIVALPHQTPEAMAQAFAAGACEVICLADPPAASLTRLRHALTAPALHPQAVDLARRNEEMEAFIYTASHDMKSPLRTIRRFAGLILEDHRDSLDADTVHMLGRIELNAGRLGDLIGDLVRVVQAGQMELRTEPCPLDEVVAEARRRLQDHLTQVGAVVEVARGLPTLSGDFEQLTDLFENLIGNAVKYRRPGVTAWVEVGILDDTPDHHHLYVRDNGQGIPEAHLERIFGLFFRLHSRDAIEGSGLGLAIVRRVAERHGGRVEVESTVGAGSTFHLWLPHAH